MKLDLPPSKNLNLYVLVCTSPDYVYLYKIKSMKVIIILFFIFLKSNSKKSLFFYICSAVCLDSTLNVQQLLLIQSLISSYCWTDVLNKKLNLLLVFSSCSEHRLIHIQLISHKRYFECTLVQWRLSIYSWGHR